MFKKQQWNKILSVSSVMKCIEHNEMSCAIKCLVQWNAQWLKQWMNQIKQANVTMNECNEISQINLYVLNFCALPALSCFIWPTVLSGQEVREVWVWLKYWCNPDSGMWLAESLVQTAPVQLHPALGHGQAENVRINSSPTVHQVTCHTVSLPCFAGN